VNGLAFAEQVTGSNWEPLIQAMLHESTQTSAIPDQSFQETIFGNLEQQIADHDVEFNGVIRDLRKTFIFTDSAAVEAFIRYHRALGAILLEAAPALRQYFGQDAQLSLDVPSEDGVPRTINAVILWRSDRTEARTALRRFDDNWLMPNLKKAGGRIVFDFELA
jgi:hypothetical protein